MVIPGLATIKKPSVEQPPPNPGAQRMPSGFWIGNVSGKEPNKQDLDELS